MDRLIRFRLNGIDHELRHAEAMPALDVLRRHFGLTGTKAGCREGDCGACLVLLGERLDGGLSWRAVPACLLALGELDGRHLVTIEGLAAAGPTPVMRALLGEGASQCGFCSPGLVVALTAFLIDSPTIDPLAAVVAVEGNLCRCTGYGAIRRAAAALAASFGDLPADCAARLEILGHRGVVPAELAARMAGFPEPARLEHAGAGRRRLAMGGGSDWLVRHPHPEDSQRLSFLDHDPALRHLAAAEGWLEIGAGVAWRDFFAHPLVRSRLPGLAGAEERLASAPIRNRATVAGNLVNASPIADLAAIFLALDARLRLRYAHSVRELPLDKFFLDYKKTALRPGEIVEAIRLPPGDGAISFEKVGKRAHLDIATVNSAAWLRLEGGRVAACRISAGGVAPVPLRLTEAEAWLTGRQLDAAAVRRAADLAMAAARPIDDVRGSADYRRRLLGRLVCVHFARLAPEAGLAEEFWP